MIPDHEDYGQVITVSLRRHEVRLTFQGESGERARRLYADLAHQLQTGVLFIAVTGKPKETLS